MRDCWLSPYGEVINCQGKWDHGGTAWKIMEDKLSFDIDKISDIIDHGSLTEGLESLGWVRYTTLPDYKTGGYDDIGWVIKEGYTPTEEQKSKMFELSGYIYELNDYIINDND